MVLAAAFGGAGLGTSMLVLASPVNSIVAWRPVVVVVLAMGALLDGFRWLPIGLEGCTTNCTTKPWAVVADCCRVAHTIRKIVHTGSLQ